MIDLAGIKGQRSFRHRPLRLHGFRALLGSVALLSGAVACGSADSGAGFDEAVDESLGAVQSAATMSAAAGPINSDTSLDLKYLPGMGYLDGTTCDIWPRRVDFRAGGARMSPVSDVLARYSIPSSVRKLQGLSNHLASLGVNDATAVGSKYELVVTPAKVAGETALVALDEATGKGFMIDDSWLCTERTLSVDPLSCMERTTNFGGKSYSVLGRTTKAKQLITGIGTNGGIALPPPTVLLVAPHVRFAPSVANGEVVADTFLIAIGQRVYGGSSYVPGEDLTLRTRDYATLISRPSLSALAATPTETDWRRAIFDRRHPGFLAVLADEVGGLKQMKAESPALIENVSVGYTHAEPYYYEASERTLYIRTGSYFNAQVSECDPTRVQGSLGTIACVYTIDLAANPRIRTAGGGAGAVLIAGYTPSTTTVTTDPSPTPVLESYSLSNLRNYLKSIVVPLLDAPGTDPTYYINILQRGETIGTIDGYAWRKTSGYARQSLNELQQSLASIISGAFPDDGAELAPIALVDAGTDTGVRQAILGGHLLSRGALADVLYGRSELESLRSGVVSPTWGETWQMMTDYNLGSRRIRGFDAQKDLGINPVKRARAAQLANYLELAPSLDGKSNVLGLAYGGVASGWFTSASDGVPSLYAAEKRWSELGSLVSAFQSAADASTKLKDRAERDTLLRAVNQLKGGLDTNIKSTAAAAKTVAAAASANAATQSVALEEFSTNYQRLFDLSERVQGHLTSDWGCAVTGTATDCVNAANGRIHALQEACDDNGGMTWMQPLVDAIGKVYPPVAAVNAGLKATTGKDITESMNATLLAASEDSHYIDAAPVILLAEADSDFDNLDRRTSEIQQLGARMRQIVSDNVPYCPKGGSAKTAVDDFKKNLLAFTDTMDNFATQLSLVHAQIDAQIGHVGYLTTEGNAYDELASSQNQLLADLNAQTQPLLDQLNALSSGGTYSQISAQQRAFMTAACGTALAATRTSQADLHLVSQALQTSTGSAETKPYLVLPANAAYHFTSGSSPDLSDTDVSYGFGMSLWDANAFGARFTPSGSSSSTSYLSKAGKRFAQLINGEVCKDTPPKPASRFVVRKVFSGQALKTLIKDGKLDFKVSLDDVVASAKDGSNAVKGVVSQNISTLAYDLQLSGAFVLGAGYSVCSGAAGKECGTRVIANNLSTVAGGALNVLYLTNRGAGYVPNALVAKKASAVGPGGASPSLLGCSSREVQVDATSLLLLGKVNNSVSACFAPVLTPRVFASVPYFDNGGLPDAQVLNNHTEFCTVDAQTLAGRPLQGVPLLGSWALGGSAASGAALATTMTPAPISEATLPVPKGATAIEVLFLVGAEPVQPSDRGGYTVRP